MGCLPRLKSPIYPGFEIRDFPSPKITTGNAKELILPAIVGFTAPKQLKNPKFTLNLKDQVTWSLPTRALMHLYSHSKDMGCALFTVLGLLINNCGLRDMLFLTFDSSITAILKFPFFHFRRGYFSLNPIKKCRYSIRTYKIQAVTAILHPGA